MKQESEVGFLCFFRIPVFSMNSANYAKMPGLRLMDSACYEPSDTLYRSNLSSGAVAV